MEHYLSQQLNKGDEERAKNISERLSHLCDADKLDEAEIFCKEILHAEPEQPTALHYLGMILHSRGDSQTARELLTKAIAAGAQDPNIHIDLGNILRHLGCFAEAAEAYRKFIALEPQKLSSLNALPYDNLGLALKAQEKFEEAADAYIQAIKARLEYGSPYFNLYLLLSITKKIPDPDFYWRKLIAAMPKPSCALSDLAYRYYKLGLPMAACEIYRLWLIDTPEHPIALHHLAACSRQNIPLRASDAYIETTFDQFADTFDQLLPQLAYRGPELIAAALARAYPSPGKCLTVLDAGCGTGLCAPVLAPYAQRLVGLDLSAAMLEKARAKNTYDALCKAELTAQLQTEPAAFDTIAAADALVYFGSLDTVLHAAHTALRPDGILIFTTEAASDELAGDHGYYLNDHGRYSHSRTYLEYALPAAGFAILSIEPASLREERGNPVEGFVVTCRKQEEEQKTAYPLTNPFPAATGTGEPQKAIDPALIQNLVQTGLTKRAMSPSEIRAFPAIDPSADGSPDYPLSSETLKKGLDLYLENGGLIIKNALPREHIKLLFDAFSSTYQHYFQDKVFNDALEVGDKRTMVTINLAGPFNTPLLYANPVIFPLMKSLLGKDLILGGIGCVTSLPGAEDQHIHRDHDPLFPPPYVWHGDEQLMSLLPPFAITLVIPLKPLNAVTGTTRMWLGSHLLPICQVRRDSELSDPMANEGDCFLMDYRQLHRGLANRSDHIRPILYFIYHRPWFQDFRNYSKQKPMHISEEEYLKIPPEYRRLVAWMRR